MTSPSRSPRPRSAPTYGERTLPTSGSARPIPAAIRAALTGRVAIEAAARASRVAAPGAGSGLKSAAGGRFSPSGVRSTRTVISSAPDTPSMAAWWILVYTASRPPASPEMRYISHSGRRRSSGRACSRLTCSASCASEPGAGSEISRTWNSMSKFWSSIQYGWSSPSGTYFNRCRSSGICGRRSSISLVNAARSRGVGDSLGSRISKPPTCPVELCVSSVKNAASRPESCFIDCPQWVRSCCWRRWRQVRGDPASALRRGSPRRDSRAVVCVRRRGEIRCPTGG